jgi:hypothetical protein
MKKPRLALLILITCLCSYAVDRWFLWGLTASKWIGLPQYEQAMAGLRTESAKWGVVAVVLGVAAFLLALPRWPARLKSDATRTVLTSGSDGDIKAFLLQSLLRAGVVGIAVFGLAAILPLAAGLFR